MDDQRDKPDFGPSRKETWTYLWVSVGGLALLAAAVAWRGIAGIMAVEVVGMALLFFGGTLVWAARRLMRMRE